MEFTYEDLPAYVGLVEFRKKLLSETAKSYVLGDIKLKEFIFNCNYYDDWFWRSIRELSTIYPILKDLKPTYPVVDLVDIDSGDDNE